MLHSLTYVQSLDLTPPNFFPNLEATCNNTLLFLSTHLPQGAKLSGLLKLWLSGALIRNFSVKNTEIGAIISFFYMATGHISLIDFILHASNFALLTEAGVSTS